MRGMNISLSSGEEEELLAAAERIIPRGFLLGVGMRTGAQAFLFPEEREAMEGSAPERQLDFICGRMIARKLLGELGIDAAPVLKGDSGEPIWPEGIAGSVSHCRGTTVVVLGRKSGETTAIGIDLEAREGVDNGMIDTVLLPSEKRLLSSHIPPSLFFSAKEACFKALFPNQREFLDFHDIEVSLSRENLEFNARVRNSWPPLKGNAIITAEMAFAVARTM